MKLPKIDKGYIRLAKGTVIAALFVGTIVGTDIFFDNYDLHFQSPIVIQTPVYLTGRKIIAPVQAVEAKVATKSAKLEPTPTLEIQKTTKGGIRIEDPVSIIESQKHSSILMKVYTLESSKGKNDGCKYQEKVNGYGYGQNTAVWNCFSTFKEVTKKVNEWFEHQLETKTLAQALCYYNTGKATSSCEYYKKYQLL